MFKLEKINKTYSIKDSETGKTLDGIYNLYNINFDEQQMEFINTKLSESSKDPEDFRQKITEYGDHIMEDLLEIDENSDNFDIDTLPFINAIFDEDGVINGEKTVKRTLKGLSGDEFNSAIEELFILASNVETSSEGILQGVGYFYKIADAKYDEIENKINDKIAKLREEQKELDNRIGAITNEAKKLFKEKDYDTIKTDYVTYATRKSSSTVIDTEEIRKDIPRRFYDRVVTLKPDKKRILTYIKKQEEKGIDVDFAHIRTNKSLNLKVV